MLRATKSKWREVVAVTTHTTGAAQPPFAYTFSPSSSAWLLATVLLLVVVFYKATGYMVGAWTADEYSHGFLIPVIAGFLVWQKRTELRLIELRGSWSGVALILLALVLDAAGRFAALFVLEHLALLLMLGGLVLAAGGWRLLRLWLMPLAVLIFMVPLPNMLLNPLSAQLQLVSSALGVKLIQAVGVPAYLQGNVIDLGSYKLEVAEACSGLRYLFPLMTLAFLMACFYHAALWKRVLIFLSSIPITLVMNSLRIATIGVLVDRFGIGVAEGFLHQVQGWMMFMLSTGVLLLEMYAITRISGDARRWSEVFGIDPVMPLAAGVPRRSRSLPVTAWAGSALLLVFSLIALTSPRPAQVVPVRAAFSSFPLNLADWVGRRDVIERVYVDQLKFDDYLLANYERSAASPVNLYLAWYDRQNAGEATHSPRACMPGGGWRIVEMKQVALDGVRVGNQRLVVNRALIRSGEQQELVYYWFQQRGRVITSEYLVKWYLMIDALERNRTDGALVRLIVPVPAGASVADAERELRAFASSVAPQLPAYVPG
jgi:exosortase D (VPLPA-CTERM-specific)